jgi:hypothetical protein
MKRATGVLVHCLIGGVFLSLVVVLAVLSSPIIQNKEDSAQQKKWKQALIDEPVPKNAIQLQIEQRFPNDEDEKKGTYLGKALSFAMDHLCNFYIADSKTLKILKFDQSGKFIKEAGRKGQGPGEFQYPREIVLDNNANVYVLDTGNGRISIFDREFQYVKSFQALAGFKYFAVDSRRFVYANSLRRIFEEDKLIEVLDGNGQPIRSFGKRIRFANNTPSHNDTLLAIGEDKYLFVLWRNINILRKYSLAGNLIHESKIKDDHYEDVSKINLKLLYPPDQWIKFLCMAICYDDGIIYILHTTYPRLMIYAINEKGDVLNKYWADTPYGYLAHSLWVKSKNDRLIIYALQSFPENTIDVYSVKK